ncbi:MAG: NAD(P)H-binding protein [Thalassotalea sp.]|nr:NAD(P)H-binding protein [Thalassotalea sp.]
MHKNNTAIVLGATGLIGKYTTEFLVEQDSVEKVIAITRKPTLFSSAKVENLVIDFERLNDFSSHIKGDVLFSCLGTTKKQAGSIAAQRIVDLDYQYKVAEIAVKNGVRRYLLVSSSAANATSKNAYLLMKGQLEEKVKALSFEQINIFQPSLLLGDRNHFRLGEVLGGIILPILCKLPFLQKYRPIKGETVARKMVNVATDTRSFQQDRVEYFVLDEIFDED